MAASIASSLATTFSVALRRTTLLPITHQQPNSVSLTKPANFPSIRTKSAENDINTFVDNAKNIMSDGKEKLEEDAGKLKDFAVDGWKEGKERMDEGVANIADTANEMAGNLAGRAGDLTEISIEKSLEAKESVQDTAKTVADKGVEDTNKAVATAVAAKDKTVDAAGDLAEKTNQTVADTFDAAKGK